MLRSIDRDGVDGMGGWVGGGQDDSSEGRDRSPQAPLAAERHDGSSCKLQAARTSRASRPSAHAALGHNSRSSSKPKEAAPIQ